MARSCRPRIPEAVPTVPSTHRKKLPPSPPSLGNVLTTAEGARFSDSISIRIPTTACWRLSVIQTNRGISGFRRDVQSTSSATHSGDSTPAMTSGAAINRHSFLLSHGGAARPHHYRNSTEILTSHSSARTSGCASTCCAKKWMPCLILLTAVVGAVCDYA